jgi:hypothetical protein
MRSVREWESACLTRLIFLIPPILSHDELDWCPLSVSFLSPMIVLFSVVQRVAWHESSRPDCFFIGLGVLYSPFLWFLGLEPQRK